MRPPALFLVLFFILAAGARAAEPFFQKGDVIALVGGEDMVVASEYGYLELLLTRALPDYHLRFRNLAWEGDTVFEQRRDLGFPTWEEQLDKIGATVVIAQFGQMESLMAGKGEGRKAKGDGPSKEEIAEFIAAYEKLIERLKGGGKRRVVLVEPSPIQTSDSRATTIRPALVDWFPTADSAAVRRLSLMDMDTTHWTFKRDGVHLDEQGHVILGLRMESKLIGSRNVGFGKKEEPLRQIIIAKNRLWFDYWRPQNWAFLAGDRTAQPSSRDHLDPSKRWFPPEREAFLPLIEAKEREIDALAIKLQEASR